MCRIITTPHKSHGYTVVLSSGHQPRQLAAARSRNADSGWISELQNELASMRAEPRRPPWRDGLPATLEASYERYRAELDDAFCPFATELELLRNRRHRFGIESE